MPIRTKKTKPLLTIQQLRRIGDEADDARAELRSILAQGGAPRTIWRTPRKYFEPGEDGLTPEPSERLNRLVRPPWEDFELYDRRRSPLLSYIFMHRLWLENAQQEVIPAWRKMNGMQ